MRKIQKKKNEIKQKEEILDKKANKLIEKAETKLLNELNNSKEYEELTPQINFDNLEKYDKESLKLLVLSNRKTILMEIFPKIKQQENKIIEKRIQSFKSKHTIDQFNEGEKVMMKMKPENKRVRKQITRLYK